MAFEGVPQFNALHAKKVKSTIKWLNLHNYDSKSNYNLFKLSTTRMELQETASTSSSIADNSTTSFSSWFDYISLEKFLDFGPFGFKAISGTETFSAVKIIFIDAIGRTSEKLNKERNCVFREYQLIQGKDHSNVF